MLAAVLVGAAALSAYWIRRQFAVRPISVCAVTDFGFRSQTADWQYRVREWFSSANRVFEPAAVRWELSIGGDAYAERTDGTLDSRRLVMDAEAQCKADVVVGFTGQPDENSSTSSTPFAHSILVATSPGDSDALVITRLSRGLAQLFAAPASTGSLLNAGSPQDGILEARSIRLIKALRQYDFARGIAGLSSRWQARAAAALSDALAGSPGAEAKVHQTLAEAFAFYFRHADAVAQLRQAVAASPRDVALRVEFAVELNKDARHGDAIAELREAARLDPEDARPHAAMAAIFLNIRRPTDAIQELRVATRLDPGNPTYQSLLGQTLAAEVGGVEDAAAAFRAVLHALPHDPVANQAMAEIDSAPEIMLPEVARLRAAVQRAPDSSDAHLELGLAYARAANTRGARAEIEKSLQLNPRNGQARLAMAQMQYMAGNLAAARAEVAAAAAAGVKASSTFLEALGRERETR
jgi:Flp pilus assembly protein TadD